MSSILNKNFSEREKISKKYLIEKQDCVPIIIISNKLNEKIKKLKYIVKKNYYLIDFILKLKIINNLKNDTSIIMKSKNFILKNENKIEEIYNRFKDKDGFLYIEIEGLQAFG